MIQKINENKLKIKIKCSVKFAKEFRLGVKLL